MAKNEMSWFRAYADMVDDEKLRLLAFEDRWHFVALLCCKRSGLLDHGDSHDLLWRKVSVKLGIHLRELEAVAGRLSEVGLIDPKTFQPLAWEERQFESDSSTARVREYRARKKQASSVPSNETEVKRYTDVSETAQETETETERAKEPALRAGAGAASADLLPAVNGNSEQRPPTDADNGATDAAPDAKRCPVQEIVALYHAMLPMCPSAEKLTRTRIGYIRARWREDLPTIEAFRNYFADVKKSRFLTGQVNGSRDRPPFVADLEWLMRPGNFAKVLEGKYHRG